MGKSSGTRKTCLRITIFFYKKLLASDRFFFTLVGNGIHTLKMPSDKYEVA